MVIKVLVDIVKMLGFIIDFLVGVFKDLGIAIDAIKEAFSYIPQVLSWLPPAVYTVVIALMVIVVLYKILGREG